MGLCPLHEDHNPSFLVDPNWNLFYCHGRGGDVIQFAELYHEGPSIPTCAGGKEN
jgi:DNA primase